MTSTDANIQQFVLERNAALRALDLAALVALLQRWGEEGMAERIGRGDDIAWASIHRARLSIDMDSIEHDFSRRWLADHGFRAPGKPVELPR